VQAELVEHQTQMVQTLYFFHLQQLAEVVAVERSL